MKYLRIKLILALVAITICLGAVGAQTKDLPFLKKNESYAKVRNKLLKAGWKPFHAEDADECQSGDARCENRPEMQSCAGTGMANCNFLWKRKGKMLAIFTVGEDASYSGHEFEK